MHPTPEYVDTKGLEAITGISASTWNKRRLTGDTPTFTKVGKSVRYHVPTVREWLAARERRSTSECTTAVATSHAQQSGLTKGQI